MNHLVMPGQERPKIFISDYIYNQRWLIHRTPMLSGSWGRGPDFTTSDATQMWTKIACSVLTQVGVSPLIMSYHPSHSAARQTSWVSLVWDPDRHAFADITVNTRPRATYENTILYQRSFTCSLHASMPHIHLCSRNNIQFTP